MVAMLVTLAIMTVLMTVALPVLTTMAQREREEELVFRGRQYARAIALFQRKYGNATPPNIDVLLNEKFLRKKYKDPITNDDFNILGPGSPELVEALNSAPQAGQQQGADQRQQGQQGQSARGGLQQPTQSGLGLNQNNQSGNAPGGVMAVASKSTKTSLRLYNGRDKYNQWVFMATQASLAAGRGGRGGRAGGAGGEAGRGRGPQPQDGRGRGPQTSPFGGGSPFGGNRGGQSQPFGGGGMPPGGQPRGTGSGPGRF